MNLKINLPKEKLGKIKRNILDFWVLKNRWIFLSIWIGLSFFVFFIWFTKIYNYEWEESKKEEYIKKKGQGIILNEKKQDFILNNMSERTEEYKKIKEIKIKDIFNVK